MSTNGERSMYRAFAAALKNRFARLVCPEMVALANSLPPFVFCWRSHSCHARASSSVMARMSFPSCGSRLSPTDDAACIPRDSIPSTQRTRRIRYPTTRRQRNSEDLCRLVSCRPKPNTRTDLHILRPVCAIPRPHIPCGLVRGGCSVTSLDTYSTNLFSAPPPHQHASRRTRKKRRKRRP